MSTIEGISDMVRANLARDPRTRRLLRQAAALERRFRKIDAQSAALSRDYQTFLDNNRTLLDAAAREE